MKFLGSDSFWAFICGLGVSLVVYLFKLGYMYKEFYIFKKMILKEYANIETKESLENIPEKIKRLDYLTREEIKYFNGQLKYKYVRTIEFTKTYLVNVNNVKNRVLFRDLRGYIIDSNGTYLDEKEEEKKKEEEYIKLKKNYDDKLNSYIKMKTDSF